MGSRLDRALGALAIAALAGCANLNAVKKDFTLTNGAAVSIDAKQRAIFSVALPGTDGKGDDKGGGPSRTVVCAEPSPDALSALAATLGVDVAVAAKSLGLAYGSQESAASIGLRTQTIQTLRDAMYRLCEGYAGGALDDVGFLRLQRRYQAVMLGLLAIEQLTGATVASQATMGGNGAAKVGNSFGQVSALVTDLRQKQIVAQATVKQKGDAVEAKKKAVTAAEADLKKATEEAEGEETKELENARAAHTARGGELAAAEGELAKAKQAEAVASADLESLEQLRKEMDRASAVTAASAQLGGVSHAASGAGDGQAAERVAQAVENIVNTIVNHDYSREACMDWMLSRTMRDSYAKNLADAPSLIQIQVQMCYEERKMAQELALAKLQMDAEVAVASARKAGAERAAPEPAPKAAERGAGKPASTSKAAKPKPPGKEGAAPLRPAADDAQRQPEVPPAPTVTIQPPPKSAFDPASAAERINKIINEAAKSKGGS